MQADKKNLDCLPLLVDLRAEGKYLSIGIFHLDASLSIIQSSIQYHPKNNEGDNGIGIMIITSCTALPILSYGHYLHVVHVVSMDCGNSLTLITGITSR